MNEITESNIETYAFEILQKLSWEYVHSLALVSGAECADRESFEQIILAQRLCKAVARLNRDIPADAQELAVQNMMRIYSPDMLQINEIRILEKLRNTLLPKLISGQIRIKNIENFIGVIN